MPYKRRPPISRHCTTKHNRRSGVRRRLFHKVDDWWLRSNTPTGWESTASCYK